jgi:dUTPase
VKGLILPNGHGVIDMDYRGEIKMIIHNPIREKTYSGSEFLNEFDINRGDKIGQLILQRHEGWIIPETYTLDNERNGGFGSSGSR